MANTKEKIICIVDYGLGNLGSVQRAILHIGATPKLVSTADGILASTHLILPGVGAFEDGMEGLRSRGLIDAIRQYAASGRPLFGICLGMQMLFSESEEFGTWKGLDLIKGRVVAMKPVEKVNIPGYKVPLIGWNSIDVPSHSKDAGLWKSTVLSKTARGAEMYFVHTFYGTPEDPSHAIATEIYGGQEMCAVVQKKNVMGTQFHPEKSGEAGIAILRAFCDLP